MIEEILDRLERIDHKEYCGGFEFADSSTFEEMGRCFDERKKLANYMKKLQQENKQLKEEIEEYRYILKMQNEREYHSKFLKDFQKEKGKNVLPDFDEIYKRYDNLKSILTELEEWLNKIIEITANLDEKGTCKNVLDKIQELRNKYEK